MVRKLTNSQLSENWNDLKTAIVRALPPKVDQESSLVRLLEKALSGEAQVWVGMEDERIKFIAVTTFILDPVTEEKHLLIYALYGYSVLSEDLWKEGIEILVSFARDTKCRKITAYTEVPRVLEMARDTLGANVKTTYLSWEV